MNNINSSNKRIAVNTIIIYVRMVLVSLISFVTTRYVLMSLGASDYGLYNVVGGVVTMLSFISIAMLTTTRRYVNIEMGKGNDGNINKVFNTCLLLHIGFAIFIYIIGLTIGLWYIHCYLNVEEGKMTDAIFVFFISTTVSALGIINVPYQAIMTAYEKFSQIAIIDIFSACLKVPLVLLLLVYKGNNLRFYAIGVCVITFLSLVAYYLYCYKYLKQDVKWKFNNEKSLYKEILAYNYYTSLGAFAYLGRSHGSVMVINFFFGTIVNGAYAIATQVENLINNLVSNIATAATPQLTQSYSAGDYSRSFALVCKITKFSALIMIALIFSLYLELDKLLSLWLGAIPEGTVILCKAMLLSMLVRSFSLGADELLMASGKVKWYQIIQSCILISGIPFSILLFNLHFPPVYIILVFIVCDIARTIVRFIILCKEVGFNFREYARQTYIPLFNTILLLVLNYHLYKYLQDALSLNIWIGLLVSILIVCVICFYVGMSSPERNTVYNFIMQKLRLRKTS